MNRVVYITLPYCRRRHFLCAVEGRSSRCWFYAERLLACRNDREVRTHLNGNHILSYQIYMFI